MRRTTILLLAFTFIFSYVQGQTNPNPNMVLNGGFEEYYSCPNYPNELELAKHWHNPMPPYSTPEYINRCGNVGNWFYVISLTNNDTTYVNRQIHYGKGAGAFLFYHGSKWDPVEDYYREYEEVELLPLEPGETYEVEFYVKLMNAFTIRYAINNIGAYFSDTLIRRNDSTFGVLYYTPHINHTSIVSDTAHYTKISGDYVATGNERYLLIGNFFPNRLTDTLNIRPTGDPEDVYKYGYYFLDEVSVRKKVNSGISNNIPRQVLNLYPNPVSEILHIENTGKMTHYELINALGKVVYTGDIHPNTTHTVDVSAYPKGIYILQTGQQNKSLQSYKIVIQ